MNPVTGKIEDLKPAKVDVKDYGVGGSLIGVESEGPWVKSSPLTAFNGEDLRQGLLNFAVFC